MKNKNIDKIASRYQLQNLSGWQLAEVKRAMYAAYRAGKNAAQQRVQSDFASTEAEIDARLDEYLAEHYAKEESQRF